MKLIIHAKNMELTMAIKSFVKEKIGSLARFLKSANSNLIEAKIEVGRPSRHHKSGPVFYAEANLKISRNLLRAESQHYDLYAAIDQVRDEMEVQIKKLKGKTRDKRKKISREI